MAENQSSRIPRPSNHASVTESSALSGSNEWYPRGLQISLHIRSPGLQDYSEVWNLKFFPFWWWWWGGILKLADLDSLTIFIFLGSILKFSDLDSRTIFKVWGEMTIFIWGYSEILGFGLSDNFHFLGGGILKFLDLDSQTIFIWGGGGVFWNSRIWTLWQFSFLGGILKFSDLDSLTIFIWGWWVFWNCTSEQGVFWGFWTKISTTPAGSCITDSLSHTTYVETN